MIAGVNGAGKSTLYQSLQSNLTAFYDNTVEFRRFAIYKDDNPIRISHNVPVWYKKFIEDKKKLS